MSPPRSVTASEGCSPKIHPAVERVFGPRVAHPAVLQLLSRFGGPTGLRQAGRRRLTSTAVKHGPRIGQQLVTDLLTALTQQTVTVPGATAAETVLHKLADSLRTVLTQRAELAAQVEQRLDAHPLAPVLTSMPGIGVRTCARVPLEVSEASAFPTSGHLAAYAGLAPVTRRSGSSIRGEHPPKGGNKNLKRAFYLAALASPADPTSRAYDDRKRTESKRHNAALICLADAVATSCTPCSGTRSTTSHAQPEHHNDGHDQRPARRDPTG